jgi:preprotein translocase subunit SecD
MLKQSTTIIFLIVALLACSDNEKVTLEFRIAEDKPAADLKEIVFEPTGEIFYLHNEVLINQFDVESAAVVMQQERPAVELILTSEGTKKFEDLTAQNIGKRCGMILNGKLLSAPIIRDTIPGGRAIITGIFTKSEAETIANGLNKK